MQSGYGEDVRDPRPVEFICDLFRNAPFFSQDESPQYSAFRRMGVFHDQFSEKRTVSLYSRPEISPRAFPHDDDVRRPAYISAQADVPVEEISFIVKPARIIKIVRLFKFDPRSDIIAVFK